MTPEGIVKRQIKGVLEYFRREHGLYYYMSVPNGYGCSTLDYLGFLYGLGFAIEAKAEGKKPSDRQEGIIDDIKASGARVFVIDDELSLGMFSTWCALVVSNQSYSGA